MDFDREVLSAEGLVLVDYWADWCAPCKMLSPILDEVSRECEGVRVVKVNTDEEMDIATKYGIRSLPTLILFRDGEKLDERVGLLSKQKLLEWLRLYIS